MVAVILVAVVGLVVTAASGGDAIGSRARRPVVRDGAPLR